MAKITLDISMIFLTWIGMDALNFEKHALMGLASGIVLGFYFGWRFFHGHR